MVSHSVSQSYSILSRSVVVDIITVLFKYYAVVSYWRHIMLYPSSCSCSSSIFMSGRLSLSVVLLQNVKSTLTSCLFVICSSDCSCSWLTRSVSIDDFINHSVVGGFVRRRSFRSLRMFHIASHLWNRYIVMIRAIELTCFLLFVLSFISRLKPCQIKQNCFVSSSLSNSTLVNNHHPHEWSEGSIVW